MGGCGKGFAVAAGIVYNQQRADKPLCLKQGRENMACKNKIYDDTAVKMFTRFELFLNDVCGADEEFNRKFNKNNEATMKDKIKYFCDNKLKGKDVTEGCRQKIESMMTAINRQRNKIVHPDTLAPVLNRDDFKELQKKCFKLEYEINEIYDKKVRIKEVLPTLKYDMGNDGDIIKHGLLVEFIEWWGKENNGKKMKIADTFAGCPWDNMSDKIRDRLERLKNTNLSAIQRKSQITDGYMGSTFLMLAAANKNKIPVHIHLSDKDEDARCNWNNAIMGYNKSITLMKPLSEYDGYKILKTQTKYDLILLDPYSNFLRDEFYGAGRTGYFSEILELAKSRPNLFIAVFVLDMSSKNVVGRGYDSFKKNELHNYTFSLRCPKTPKEKMQISGETRGETSFNSEILLISQQIADKKCGKLRRRLRNFAEIVTQALPLPADKKVEFNIL